MPAGQTTAGRAATELMSVSSRSDCRLETANRCASPDRRATVFVVARRGGWFVIVMTALVSCTTSPSPSPTPKPTTAPFARYFFIAPDDTGVLEVAAHPASICYSTQSYPARPIMIVQSTSLPFDFDTEVSRPVATYRPETGTFCDRQVSEEVAARLIADPSSFAVRWSPQANEPVVATLLTTIPVPTPS